MYEWWLAEWFPRQGRVFVDIGANAGRWTQLLAPGFARGHAIEPDPDALLELRTATPANVRIHPVAAWDAPGSVRCSRFASSVHTSAYFEDEGINSGPPTGSAELPCMTIDALPIDGPVDFVKCDTEGAEVHVLRGAAQLIARDRPWLLIEVHSMENLWALLPMLAAWHYSVSTIRHPEYPPYSPLWHTHCWLSCQAVDRDPSRASTDSRTAARS